MAFGDIVQSKTNTTAQGGATSVTVTLDSTPTDGNLLVAASLTRAASQSTPSGWSVGHSEDHTAQTDNLTIYYKIAGSSEPTGVTFTDSVSGQIMLAAVYEIEGPFNATPLDATNGNNNSSSSTIATSSTGTLSQADEFIFATATLRANSTSITASSVDSSFTESQDAAGLYQDYGGSPTYPSYLTTAYKLVSSTSAENPTFTFAGSHAGHHGIAAIATFKKQAGVAGDVMTPLQRLIRVRRLPHWRM